MTEKPILYMPIGLPASGKSTFMKKLENTVILSGDTLRGELFGDESLQYTDAFLIEHGYDAENMTHREKEIAGQTLVWNMLKDRAIQLLKEGKNVAYDGVNNVPKYRALILVPASGIAVLHALVFNTDIETCIARDRMRARHAGEKTIRHVAKYMTAPDFSEGFDIIDTINKNGELVSHRTKEKA